MVIYTIGTRADCNNASRLHIERSVLSIMFSRKRMYNVYYVI